MASVFTAECHQIGVDDKAMLTYMISLHLSDKRACTLVRQSVTEEDDNAQLQ